MVGSLVCVLVAPAALGTLSPGPEPAAWASPGAIRPLHLVSGFWDARIDAPAQVRHEEPRDAGPAFPPTTPAPLPIEACAAALAADEPAAVMVPADPPRGFGPAPARG